jgi:hypothetical protein
LDDVADRDAWVVSVEEVEVRVRDALPLQVASEVVVEGFLGETPNVVAVPVVVAFVEPNERVLAVLFVVHAARTRVPLADAALRPDVRDEVARRLVPARRGRLLQLKMFNAQHFILCS